MGPDNTSTLREETLDDLQSIEDDAWLTLRLLRQRGFTSHFRETAFMLATIITLQQISGNGNIFHSSMIAFILGK
jgi:hypothetical protein